MTNSASFLFLSLLSFPAKSGELNSCTMEALLVKSMNPVGSTRPDVALNEVDTLIQINPKLKLAQMLNGSLLKRDYHWQIVYEGATS